MSKTKQTEGVISIAAVRKSGYVSDPDSDNDIEIREAGLNHALHGDTVLVETTGETLDDKPQGKVIKIIKRAQTRFVGLVEKRGSRCFILPDSRKMYVDIFLNEKDCERVNNDEKVYVEIGEWPDDKPNPTGKLIEILGLKGNHEVEMKAILLEKGIDSDFPKAVDEEANQVNNKFPEMLKEQEDERRDFKNITTFTIDPKDAKDFDDALSVNKLENGNYEIGIHIADVSEFVKPGTKLDEEAYERAFSVYLVDRTIPMLPEVLSNGICSLNPNEDRFAFSAVFEMNDNAEVLNEWFGKSIINSDKRFSYEEAQEVLDKQDGEYLEELNILSDLSKKLTKRKMNAGAIAFEKDEFEFELDANKVPLKIIKKEHIHTHKLIEEFMLLANRHVAKFIHDKCKENSGGTCSLMYRVHNVPEAGKLEELSTFLRALGYKFELKPDGSISPQDINNLLAQVHGKPEEGLVSTAAIRTMSKALYSPNNSGHFGLAFEYYTHFTSPIRRYPDLIVHRILQNILTTGQVDSKDGANFAKIAEHSSNQEVNAQTAERESIRYKQVEFMMNHVGEEFDGIISGAAPFGIFVLLDDSGAEGMIHISKLGEEYFNYDEKNYRIVSENGSKKFQLGDKIRVKIDGADLDNRKLEMSLVEKKK